MKEYLFSYGTLQLEKVQIESFGRKLKGSSELLKGFKIEHVRITDELVLAKSEKEIHPIAIPTGNEHDEIVGKLYEISSKELIQADLYEVSDYKRVEVTFESNNKGWVYIKL